MNVCRKCYGNPFDSYDDSSLKIINVNLMVALEEKSGVTKLSRINRLRTMNFCANFQVKSVLLI